MLKGFCDFILRGNVVDLAVAVVIGVAFTAIVNALVADIINPLIRPLSASRILISRACPWRRYQIRRLPQRPDLFSDHRGDGLLHGRAAGQHLVARFRPKVVAAPTTNPARSA